MRRIGDQKKRIARAILYKIEKTCTELEKSKSDSEQVNIKEKIRVYNRNLRAGIRKV